ncbi:hypothetical protein Ddc_04923 [Ditylenchus destructor]|nr:hypothetical protein Ddc_04923 [Ditylenchus destructor]
MGYSPIRVSIGRRVQVDRPRVDHRNDFGILDWIAKRAIVTKPRPFLVRKRKKSNPTSCEDEEMNQQLDLGGIRSRVPRKSLLTLTQGFPLAVWIFEKISMSICWLGSRKRSKPNAKVRLHYPKANFAPLHFGQCNYAMPGTAAAAARRK